MFEELGMNNIIIAVVLIAVLGLGLLGYIVMNQIRKLNIRFEQNNTEMTHVKKKQRGTLCGKSCVAQKQSQQLFSSQKRLIGAYFRNANPGVPVGY